MTATAAALLSQQWEQPKTKEEILQDWLDAKEILDVAKNAEMEARKAVVAAFPIPSEKKEGTVNVPLANGWKLKVVLKQNYSLDKEATDEALDELEKSGEQGKFVADRLVSWSPSLSISEYRLLTDEHKKIIDKVLTIKDGSPTVELVDPKGK